MSAMAAGSCNAGTTSSALVILGYYHSIPGRAPGVVQGDSWRNLFCSGHPSLRSRTPIIR